MHSNKRRRLNDSSNVLSKPFRSPLKAKSGNHRLTNDQTNSKKDGQSASLVNDSAVRTTSRLNRLTNSNTNNVIGDVDKLQREYSALSQQLRKHRQDLDSLQQASRIRDEKQQERVDTLIVKWKAICRDVAEDLFDSTSKQIQNMGGMQVWQQQAVQAREGDWYDTKGDHSSQPACEVIDNDVDDDLDTASRDQEQSVAQVPVSSIYAAIILIKVLIKYQQHFTMDTMLHQLNINPDLLGFDASTEQWLN